MTIHHHTADNAESNNTRYPYLVVSNARRLHLAEDGDDYTAKSLTRDSLSEVLKRTELRALRSGASAQIGRLYNLANVLLASEHCDHSAEEVQQIALEVRNATSLLEDTLHAIVGPIVDDPKPGQEEIAE